jgi:putative transposase
MHIFIDESGSFTGYHPRSISVVAALAIPNGNIRGIRRKYARIRPSLPKDNGEVKGRLEHAVFFRNRDSQIGLDVIQDPCWGARPAWMTRPYSEDLRERALARFEAGETIRSIGQALGISPSCVSKWRRRERETGSLSPGQIGGHKPRVLSGASADWLRERCRSGPFTTRGLTAELAARGIKTDRRAVWVFARAEGLSFKKKAFCQPSRIGRTSLASGSVGRPTNIASPRNASPSSTRPGSRPIWRRFAAGDRGDSA